MKPPYIKATLEDAGFSLADVARQCDVSHSSVSLVVHGRSRSRKIELRIAALTRLPLAELWPKWHGADATRRRRKQVSTSAAALRAAS